MAFVGLHGFHLARGLSAVLCKNRVSECNLHCSYLVLDWHGSDISLFSYRTAYLRMALAACMWFFHNTTLIRYPLQKPRIWMEFSLQLLDSWLAWLIYTYFVYKTTYLWMAFGRVAWFLPSTSLISCSPREPQLNTVYTAVTLLLICNMAQNMFFPYPYYIRNKIWSIWKCQETYLKSF